MKKLFYIILLAIFLILDAVIISTSSNSTMWIFYAFNSTMWIFYAFIIAEVAIYSTCIIFEIITLQNKLKDKNSDEDDND